MESGLSYRGCLAPAFCRPYCLAPIDFGRSVNPVQTRVGGRLCPSHYYLASAAPKSYNTSPGNGDVLEFKIFLNPDLESESNNGSVASSSFLPNHGQIHLPHLVTLLLETQQSAVGFLFPSLSIFNHHPSIPHC
jgi:hypothetical protein